MLSSFILLPFFVLILTSVAGPRVYQKWTLGGIGVAFFSQIVCAVFGAQTLTGSPPDLCAALLGLRLKVDAISLVVLAAIGLAAMASMAPLWYWAKSKTQGYRLLSLMLLSVTAMNAAVLTVDLFTLYIFVEIVAISSFIMIAFTGEKNGLEGAFKYMVMSGLASVFMLAGLAMIFMKSGDLTFDVVRLTLASSPESLYFRMAVILFVVGGLIKSGLVPFHGWLPDAYQAAPAPVSVLLAGVITKTSGVYVLMRLVLSVFGLKWAGPILMGVGLVSIVAGALGALAQKNIKRMLAYSSISQIGYIALGVSCGSVIALAGALLHVLNHAIFKSLLFNNAAHIEQRTGQLDFDRLGALDKEMPTTSWSSLVGFLSTAGIPPLSGFWSKFLIIWGLWISNYRGSAFVALMASLITAAYFLKMQRRIFWGTQKGCEVSGASCAGLSLTEVGLSVVTVALGFAFPYLIGTVLVPMGGF